MAAEHTDFWVVVGTVAPIVIAINVPTFAQAVSDRDLLKRGTDTTFTARRLRPFHLFFVVLNLLASLALIFLALVSLWWRRDAASGWLAIALLFAMLIELFVLAVCSDALTERSRRKAAQKNIRRATVGAEVEIPGNGAPPGGGGSR